jgi:hypothetical protein
MGRIIKFPYEMAISTMPAHQVNMGLIKALMAKSALKHGSPTPDFWKEIEEVVATVIPDMVSWNALLEEGTYKITILACSVKGKYEYGVWIGQQFFPKEFW